MKEERFEQMRREVPEASVNLLMADQVAGVCELDHSGDPRGPGPYKATNTLMIPSGSSFVSLPICSVCEQSLAEENSEWLLFICFGCFETRWMRKTECKQEYKEQIIGMNNCPNCGSIKV